MSFDVVRVDEQAQVAVVSRDQTGALEARIRSEIGARTALALARPRDLDLARERLLKDARRPGFATVAEYVVPRGGSTIRGPSIRMAESVARALGNLDIQVVVVAEDQERRLLEAVVADLEANLVFRQAFVIRKIVERRKLPPNTRQEDILGQRAGADGQVLYLIRASEQDLAMQQAAQASRVMRGLILRVAPGDLVEEAMQVARETREREDAQDPAQARKRIADAFAGIGVSVAALKDHLGHPLDQCSPAEIDMLRGLYAAIKDGATTWAEVAAPAQPEDPTAKARETALRAAKKEVSHE